MNNGQCITVLVGLPGSGKSTLLAKGQVQGIVICPDEFRLVITGRYHFPPLEDIVWFNVKTTTRILLEQGYSIVVDATCLAASWRRLWIKFAQEFNIPCECIWLDVPYEVCYKRNGQRDRELPDDAMERMRDLFETPTVEEGFCKVTRLEVPDEQHS